MSPPGDDSRPLRRFGGASVELVPLLAVPDALRADVETAGRLAARLAATGRGALAEGVEMALTEALALARAPHLEVEGPLGDLRAALAALEVELEAPSGPAALGELAEQAWRLDQLVDRLRRARAAAPTVPPPVSGGAEP